MSASRREALERLVRAATHVELETDGEQQQNRSDDDAAALESFRSGAADCVRIGDEYQEVLDRLLVKWETARTLVPEAEIRYSKFNKAAILSMGSSDGACKEALDRLEKQKVGLNYCRVKAFPFTAAVREFIDAHDVVYVVEQNRDAQLRTLLISDIEADQEKLVSLLHYNGMPLNAGFVVKRVLEERAKGQAA